MQDALAIGPLSVERCRTSEAIGRIVAALDAGTPLSVGFCNAHTATLALRDAAYARTLSGMLLLNDGIGLELGARFLSGRGFPENLNGTDFVPAMLTAIERPLRIFLIGARPDVVSRAAAALIRRFPQHRVVGVRDGYFDDAGWPAIVAAVRDARPDVVLCAMGNPRQEAVIAALAPQIGRGVYLGVGALFDFLGGAVPRAPAIVRRLRLEFLYRLSREPRRLMRRYTLEVAEFFVAIARLRLSGAAR